MTTTTVNLPQLPSEIINKSDLLKGYWIEMAADPKHLIFANPTTPGLVDSICGLGAILRSFGLSSPSTNLNDAVNYQTECGEFMIALARKIDPKIRDREATPNDGGFWASSVKLSIVRWSDKPEVSKSDVVVALQEIETELGYRA